VFEVGYMIGQGKPAFGFTLDNRRYRERTSATDRDEQGHTIEDFELSDNLMIEGGIRDSGGQLFVAEQAGARQSLKQPPHQTFLDSVTSTTRACWPSLLNCGLIRQTLTCLQIRLSLCPLSHRPSKTSPKLR